MKPNYSTTIALVVLWLATSNVILAGQGFLNVGMKSDYVFRGLTQSDGNASVNFYAQYKLDSGVYLASFISNVDYGHSSSANTEIDAVFGYSHNFNDFWIDAKYIVFTYTGDSNFNMSEARVLAGSGNSIITLGYSNNWAGTGDTLNYVEFAYKLEILDEYQMKAQIGKSYYIENIAINDFENFLISVSKNIGGVNVSLTATTTRGGIPDEFGGERIVFGVNHIF